MKTMLQSKKLPVYAVYILSSLLLLFFIGHFGVNIPWGDDWDLLPLIENNVRAGVKFWDLFSLHNEHRIVIPNLIMIANAKMFSLNLKYQMYLNGLLLMAICLVCITHFLKNDNRAYTLLAIFSPVILYTSNQYENLLWGFQVGFMMSLFMPVLSFHLLEGLNNSSSRPVQLGTAIIAGLLGSFSSVQGLLVWPCGLLMLLTNKEKIWKESAIWGVVSTLVWVGYYHDYAKPQNHPALDFILKNPLEGFRYFCTLMGNIVAWNETFSLLLGLITLAGFIVGTYVAITAKKFDTLRFWFFLGLFLLMTLVAITVGRAGVGIGSAFWSRYVTYTSLFLLTVIAILCGASSRRSIIISIHTFVLVSVVGSALPFSYRQGLQKSNFLNVTLSNMRVLLHNYRIVPTIAMKPLYKGDDNLVKNRTPLLESLEHEIFKHTQS